MSTSGVEPNYWQRRVPLDLLQRYDSPNIKVNLNSLDPQVVIRKVEALNSKVEAEWAAMRNDEQLTPVQARAAAMVLLKRYGLQPHPYRNQEATLDHFLDRVVYPKLEAYAAGDEVAYTGYRRFYVSGGEHVLLYVDAEGLDITQIMCDAFKDQVVFTEPDRN